MGFSFRSMTDIIRVIELVLVSTCLALNDYSSASDDDIALICAGTYVAYVIIVGGLVLAMFFSWATIPKEIFLMYYVVGAILFVTSGILSIHYFKRHSSGRTETLGISKGAISIAEGALFAFDVFTTYRSVGGT